MTWTLGEKGCTEHDIYSKSSPKGLVPLGAREGFAASRATTRVTPQREYHLTHTATPFCRSRSPCFYLRPVSVDKKREERGSEFETQQVGGRYGVLPYGVLQVWGAAGGAQGPKRLNE